METILIFPQKPKKLFLIQLNIFNFNINVKISILYIIGSLFYYWSLATINLKNRIQCLKTQDFKCFYSIAENVLVSSIIIDISIYLILFFKLKKFHLFIIFLIYIFLFLIDHESELIRHGIYNFLGFIFLLLLFFIIYCYTKFLFFFYKKLKYRNIYFGFFFFLFLLYFYSSIYIN